MTFPLTAKKSFPYAGKRLRAGQDFEARTSTDARVLVAIGNARPRTLVAPARVQSQPQGAPTTYSTRAVTAAETAPPAAPEYQVKVDGADVVLDAMEVEGLRELAQKLGMEFHPLTGAKKLRAALVEFQKVAQ